MALTCPNCSHKQIDAKYCANCGVSFDEPNEAPQQHSTGASDRSAIIRARVAESKRLRKKGRPGLLFPCIILGCSGILFWLLFSGDDKESKDNDLLSNISLETSTSPDLKAAEETDFTGLAKQIGENFPASNKIEAARNATVFIQTSWGTLGSGFIVNSQCKVFTNRHVIDPKYGIDQLEESEEFNVAYRSAASVLRDQISGLENQYKQLREEYREKHIKVVNVKTEIDKKKRKLANLKNNLRVNINDSIDRALSNSKFTASLVDGTSFEINNYQSSDKFDLASFTLPVDGCPTAKIASNSQLNQGGRLFTIGNPSGLQFTVTSGVFSGYRDIGETRILQTDAPINPGNSGGPLINEEGFVIGVNTATLSNAQNIGFSIPIEYALQEF